MANLSSFSLDCDNLYNERNDHNYFDLPLLENDILTLQQVFVTQGVQYIKTKNVESGRKIINMILASLKYYKKIGCVTQNNLLPLTACNILDEIEFEKNRTGNLLFDLENFFTVNPSFDFIWMELSKKLSDEYSCVSIKNIFDMYHVEERLPVLIVTYTEE